MSAICQRSFVALKNFSKIRPHYSEKNFDILMHILLCSALFITFEKPSSLSLSIKKDQYIKVLAYAAAKALIIFLFFIGLRHVGPYRTAFLTQHSHAVVIAFCSAIYARGGTPGQVRGALWMILGITSLVLFDNDSSSVTHPEGTDHTQPKHLFYSIISWCGLSDHEAGIVMLLIASLMSTVVSQYQRHLSREMGGSQLNVLTWLVISTFLTPWAIIGCIMEGNIFGLFIILPYIVFVSVVWFFASFYIEQACNYSADSSKMEKVSSISMFSFSLLWVVIAPFWSSSPVRHGLSGGAVMSFIFFSLATMHLNSLPLHTDLAKASLPFRRLSRSSLSAATSVSSHIVATLKAILADSNSKIIFYFLCINLGFTFVELAYGFFTNSLGLISDGFHMLFDCSALVMGLTASVMAKWPPTKTFPFGYRRIELLSGFINALFLTFIGFMVLFEALKRLSKPPEITTDRLLVVAVGGLMVNFCGIVAFRGSSHGHSHNGSHGHSHNANMQGVFLHVLADTLGSVAVIISTVLIDWYGWLIADPICSIILSCLILGSVLPLVEDSASLLVLKVDSCLSTKWTSTINEICHLSGVTGCGDPHLWQNTKGLVFASIKVYVTGEVAEQTVLHQVQELLSKLNIEEVTIEISIRQSVIKTKASTLSIGTILSHKPFESSVRNI